MTRGRWALAAGVILLLYGAQSVYFQYYPRAGSDPAHLEGTVINIPEHPDQSVRIRYNNSFLSALGALWFGESSKGIDGMSFGAKIEGPRWSISLDPGQTISLEQDEKDTLFLIPFLIRDNSLAYINKLPGNEDVPQLLALNGNPDGHLTYVGLFSWNGKGAKVYRGAVLVGNLAYLKGIRETENGDFLVTYTGDAVSESSWKYLDYSLFKHAPVPYGETHSLTIRVENQELVEVSRI